MITLKLKASLIVLGALLGTGSTLALQSIQKHIALSHPAEKHRTPEASVTALLIAGEPSLGDPQAPITIIEFSDFECPYCKRFHETSFQHLKKEYINKGLVRFIHKDLPLPFHANAHLAASISRCAQNNEQYWKVYKAFFDRQNCMSCVGPSSIAAKAGLDQQKIKNCLKEGRATQAVNTNLSEAELQSIQATPTFIVGATTSNRHSGKIVEGALPWEDFKKIIEKELLELKR